MIDDERDVSLVGEEMWLTGRYRISEPASHRRGRISIKPAVPQRHRGVDAVRVEIPWADHERSVGLAPSRPIAEALAQGVHIRVCDCGHAQGVTVDRRQCGQGSGHELLGIPLGSEGHEAIEDPAHDRSIPVQLEEPRTLWTYPVGHPGHVVRAHAAHDRGAGDALGRQAGTGQCVLPAARPSQDREATEAEFVGESYHVRRPVAQPPPLLVARQSAAGPVDSDDVNAEPLGQCAATKM